MVVKNQNLENFYPRPKRTWHNEIFFFGSGFALFMEPTQQAAGYSASQNKDDGCRDHPPSTHYDPPPPLLHMA
jgi:hypothetical protein